MALYVSDHPEPSAIVVLRVRKNIAKDIDRSSPRSLPATIAQRIITESDMWETAERSMVRIRVHLVKSRIRSWRLRG